MADTGTRPAGRDADRNRVIRLTIAIAGCLLAVGWLWAARVGHPADDTVVSTAAQAWQPDGVVVTDAAGAGNPLRAGDLVTAVDGRPLTAVAPDRPALRIGDEVIYDVVRDGSRIRVSVKLTDYPFWTLVARHWATLPNILLLLLVGSLVVARRPRDPSAVALYGLAALQLAGLGSSQWAGTQVIDIATGRLWVTTVAEIANCLVWPFVLMFAATFPRPWPVLRRRPWLAGPVFAAPFVAYAGMLVVFLPGLDGLQRVQLLVAVSMPAAAFFPVLTLGAVVVSYVLARDPSARHRIRLISYGLALLATGYLLIGQIPELVIGHPLVSWEYFSLVCVVPAQLIHSVAILRYRLWDIQIILRRSLVGAVVTVGLMVVYLGVAAAISASLDTHLRLAPVLVALVVALSFSAARTTLRRVVSRLVYGEREDPYEVLRQLGRRLGSTGSAEAVLNQLVATLVRTLRLSHAAVEVPGLDLVSSGRGRPGPTPTSIDLVHDGERIGRLVLDPGPDREPFGTSDRLLEGLAQQVSATAHSLLLAARLQRSLEGTVTKLEEERRRMRREIHDGLGPTIASASMRLELGRSLIRTDPDATERILAELAGIHRSVVQDMRRLVDGLRPIILDHAGLDAAVRELVTNLGGSVRTNLDCALGTARLPAAVEVAAYRIVSEALTNVVRHAAATVCDVRIWSDRDVFLEIRDNGRGLPSDYRPGMGLTSIRERCAELGGTASITPNLPAGTQVICRLPIPATGIDAYRPATPNRTGYLPEAAN